MKNERFSKVNYQLHEASSFSDVKRIFQIESINKILEHKGGDHLCVVLDHRFGISGNQDGLVIAKWIKDNWLAIHIIAFSGHHDENYNDYVELGAEVVDKDENEQEIPVRIISWLDRHIGVVDQIESRIRELLGTRSKATAKAVSEAVNFVREKEPGPFVLLITGEMGEGKNYLAEVIHQVAVENGFREGELQIVNIVASGNTQDIRAALFGSKLKDNPIEGAFPRAKNGTVVIDEVGSYPPEVQENLLTAIDPGTYRPLFGDQEKNEAWVIMTTNHPEKIIEELADRCTHIELPPISQRQEDIEILVENVLSKYAPDYKLGVGAKLDLKNYVWKNVRQIVKVIFETIKAKRAKSYDSLQIGPEEIVWISANQPEGISSQKKESVTVQPDFFSQDTWFSELDKDKLIKLCRDIWDKRNEVGAGNILYRHPKIDEDGNVKKGGRGRNHPEQIPKVINAELLSGDKEHYIRAVMALFKYFLANDHDMFLKLFGFQFGKKYDGADLRVYLQSKSKRPETSAYWPRIRKKSEKPNDGSEYIPYGPPDLYNDGLLLKQNGIILDIGE